MTSMVNFDQYTYWTWIHSVTVLAQMKYLKIQLR